MFSLIGNQKTYLDCNTIFTPQIVNNFFWIILKGKKTLTHTGNGRVVSMGFLVVSFRIENFVSLYSIIPLIEVCLLKIVIDV